MDRRLQHDLHPLAAQDAHRRRIVLNPLRSEAEAFRFLVYVVIVVAAIVAAVLLGRALL